MLVPSSNRVERGYRTTVLRGARRLLGLGLNDALEWVFENGKVYMRKRVI